MLSGMEVPSHMMGGLDLYIAGQVIVEGLGKQVYGVGAAGKEIHHLALSVGSGIGPAGAAYPDGFTGEALQGRFDFPLNGGLPILQLETSVSGPVVLHNQGQPSDPSL